MLYLLRLELRIDRKAQELSIKALCVRKRVSSPNTSDIGRLLMHRLRVVKRRHDTTSGEVLLQLIPLLGRDHILVHDVSCPRNHRGGLDREPNEGLRIKLSDLLSPSIASIELLQSVPQYRSLELVEPAVTARDEAYVSLLPSILSELADSVCHFSIISNRDAPAVTERPKILRWIEAKRSDISNTPDLSAVPESSMSLRAILNNFYAARLSNSHNLA